MFIFYTNRTWGDVTEAVIRGKRYTVDQPVDGVADVIADLQRAHGARIVARYDHVPDNNNQVTHLVNEIILVRRKFGYFDISNIFSPCSLNLQSPN